MVAPPSVHASGASYRWERFPDVNPLAPLPDWLLRLIGNGTQRNLGPATGPAAESFLAQAFEANGWLDGGVTHNGAAMVECPWQAEHTDNRGDGHDSSTVILPPTPERPLGSFHCSHSHCQHRGTTAVLLALPRAALLEMANWNPEGFDIACELIARRMAA